MKKFRYYDGSSYGYEYYGDLTYGKVYDVIRYINREEYLDRIIIINDKGIEGEYVIALTGVVLFVDVTEEYRNEIIDGILT